MAELRRARLEFRRHPRPGANFMPVSPQRTRAVTGWIPLVALAAALVALPSGCELLRPDRQSEPTARSAQATETPPPPPPAPATLPGKHATRRGYYVFYHDFEWDTTDPLFADLESLPEQERDNPRCNQEKDDYALQLGG